MLVRVGTNKNLSEFRGDPCTLVPSSMPLPQELRPIIVGIHGISSGWWHCGGTLRFPMQISPLPPNSLWGDVWTSKLNLTTGHFLRWIILSQAARKNTCTVRHHHSFGTTFKKVGSCLTSMVQPRLIESGIRNYRFDLWSSMFLTCFFCCPTTKKWCWIFRELPNLRFSDHPKRLERPGTTSWIIRLMRSCWPSVWVKKAEARRVTWGFWFLRMAFPDFSGWPCGYKHIMDFQPPRFW